MVAFYDLNNNNDYTNTTPTNYYNVNDSTTCDCSFDSTVYANIVSNDYDDYYEEYIKLLIKERIIQELKESWYNPRKIGDSKSFNNNCLNYHIRNTLPKKLRLDDKCKGIT